MGFNSGFKGLKCSDTQNCYIRLLFTLTAKKNSHVILEGPTKGSQNKTIQAAGQNIRTWYSKTYRLTSRKDMDYQPMWWWKNPRRQPLYHFSHSCGKYVKNPPMNQPKELNSFLYTQRHLLLILDFIHRNIGIVNETTARPSGRAV